VSRLEPMQADPAVVLGLSPGGLYLVRALGDAGIPVYGAADKNESGLYSKYLSRDRRWKQLDEEELLRRIKDLGEKHGAPPVLLPSSDRWIEWISQNFEQLREMAVFSESYQPDQYTRFLDKDLFYEVCREIGVPYPLRCRLEDIKQLSRDASGAFGRERLKFPLLIKAGRLHEVTDIMGSKKVFVCRDESDLRRYTLDLPRDRGGWLVQEIVEGPDDDIFCLGGVHTAEGRIEAPVSGRKLRQFPPGFGTAAALRLESPPRELWEYTGILLAALKLDGIFEIEFKRDQKDGVWKVFEINPRTALWFGAARTAGIPLAESVCRAHTGRGQLKSGMIRIAAGKAGTVSRAARNSTIIWRTGVKNFIAAGLRFLRGGGRTGRTKTGKHENTAASWAFWEIGDPLPACLELLSYAGKVFQKIRGKLRKGRV